MKLMLTNKKKNVSALLLAIALTGCGESEPFSMVQVSGTVRYDDGTLIPAQHLVLTFTPEAKPIDAKTYPRPGHVEVNVKEGTFDVVTSIRYGDGLVVGKHRVCILAQDENQTPLRVIPVEYSTPSTTPLVISTEDRTLEIRVPRPR